MINIFKNYQTNY